MSDRGSVVLDSIIEHVRGARAIERCDVFGKPPFAGKASDDWDIGVRYTPEMIEILKKALELRKKGIIKF